MKNSYLFFIAFISFFISSSQVFLNDDFNYEFSSGELISDSDGEWNSLNSGTPKVGFTDTGLTLSDYPANVNTGAVTITNSNGEVVDKPFVAVNPGKLYYSALVNLSSVGTGNSGFFMSLKISSSATEDRARVFAKDDGFGGINFGIISKGDNIDIVWTSGSYSLNTTYLIVASFDTLTGVSNLYVLNGPTLDDTITPDATHTTTTISGFDSFKIRQHMNGPVGTIDGIRVASEWVYLMIDISLTDGPPNGDSIVVSPESINDAEVDFATTSFVMSNDTGGGISDGSGMGFIKWEVRDTSDNSLTDSGNIFTSNNPLITYPVNNLVQGETYVLTARLVDNDGSLFDSGNLDFVYTLTFTVANYTDVSDLASLRSNGPNDEVFYRVTGPVTNTYAGEGGFNEQYFQDGTAGIVVLDIEDEIISYNKGDVINNIKGQLFEINGMLTLVPTNASWEAPSSNNPITPEVVTTTQIRNALDGYESELVQIQNATFLFPGGTFDLGQVHLITDGGAMNFAFRCSFTGVDYLGTTILATPQDIVGIIQDFNGAPRIVARSLSDISNTLGINDFKNDNFKLYPNPTSLGYINIASKNQSSLKISVLDVLGKQISSESIKSSKLDVSHLKSGLYLLKIEYEGNAVTKKLVIQ